jgi:uncharacterized membrane protein
LLAARIGNRFQVNKSALWIAKSLLIALGIALAVSVGLYAFLKIHQELEIAPAYAWGMGAAAFMVSTLGFMIYYRMRAQR